MGLRETYLLNAETKLKTWKSEVDQLKASLNLVDIQKKKYYEDSLKKVFDSFDRLMVTFDQLNKAGENTWQKLITRMEDEMVEFRTNLSNSLTKIKAKRIKKLSGKISKD